MASEWIQFGACSYHIFLPSARSNAVISLESWFPMMTLPSATTGVARTSSFVSRRIYSWESCPESITALLSGLLRYCFHESAQKDSIPATSELSAQPARDRVIIRERHM